MGSLKTNHTRIFCFLIGPTEGETHAVVVERRVVLVEAFDVLQVPVAAQPVEFFVDALRSKI